MSYSQAIADRKIQFYGLGKRMTAEQLEFVKASETQRVLFVDSIAGGGKTTMAVALAKYLTDAFPDKFHKALYTFSPVEEGKMGFRPGTQREKDAAYITPLKDALLAINEDPSEAIKYLDEDGNEMGGIGWITAASHTFMRGINLPNQIVIIDEAQNFTMADLKKVITRAHETSLIIVIGHRGQCDLKNPKLSGFIPYLLHYSRHPQGWVGKFTFNFRGEIARHADRLHKYHILENGDYVLTVVHDDGTEEEVTYEFDGQRDAGQPNHGSLKRGI